jgi:D-hydroxyproline dehydrogenase subunit beta
MTSHPTPAFDIIVAGAGVVGASIAWHAAQQGMRVAVVDAVGPAAGASGASDGAVSVASKRPGIMTALACDSLTYCHAMVRRGGPLKGVFSTRPSYFFASDLQEAQALDGLVARVRGMDGPVHVVNDQAGPIDIVAHLGASVQRVVEIGGEGHMLGYQATQAYLAAAQVRCFWGESVEGFVESDAGVEVRLGATRLRASQLVLALGVGTRRLLPGLPVLPRAGQLIVTDAPGGGMPSLPGSLTAAAYLLSKAAGKVPQSLTPVVIDPLKTGQFLIGSSREPHGDSRRTDLGTVQALLRRAVACYPALARRRVIRTFTGVRAAVDDGLPIVGRLGGHARSWVATGFEGDGICLSALIGRDVAAMLAGSASPTALDALSPARFAHAAAA